jgi:hypothetical protein
MPRSIDFDDDGLAISFKGLVRLGTLRRRLIVPWSAIRGVHAGSFDLEATPLRVVAPRLGRSAHGRFRRGGRWQFLSFEDPRCVVRVELDRRAPGSHGFDELVVGARDPRSLADAIALRAGLRPTVRAELSQLPRAA